MQILLIRPSNVYNYNNYPPLNLILLASVLKKSGFETKIVNAAFEQDIEARLTQELPSTSLVVLTALTPEMPDAIRIMKIIKRISKVPIVIGGWHSTLFPDQTAASDLADYVVIGDGESHIVNIAKWLQTSKICVKINPNMESLPEPDYSLCPDIERFITSQLTDAFMKFEKRKPFRWLPYESSRGCPSECAFCINVVAGNRMYRKKSAQKVVSEIINIVNKYKLSHIKIIDDNFFVDIKRAREIAELISQIKIYSGIQATKAFIKADCSRSLCPQNWTEEDNKQWELFKSNIPIMDFTWDAECRCDYFNDRILNDETLSLLKNSGLVQLTLGIESGSQKSLDRMRKHITVDQARNAIAQCNKYGIVARSSFILEIPGDTLEDTQLTIRFINEMREKYPYFFCGVGTFRPYPKCELTEGLIGKNYLKEPSSIEEWASRDIIDMYTAAEYIRPWQANGKYAVSAAFYLNMESGARLGNHQIRGLADRMKNTLYISIAKIRNKFMFYELPLDRAMYEKFLKNYYARTK